ncbi:hypothetical protein LCM10_05095 [Rossellomorea aquimaris]|uniref:hypothetical protein n=1 Tax=Rossellomorea aquimaris TaxID=189382 RepID=UPI001CD49248|nr:hypothetical protein [Rossellomorea aquimaris]MCA1054354.1 hypothetical protein [Rossellomorea aquimaris]
MKKKWLFALSAAAVVVMGITFIHMQKPHESDLVKWLSDHEGIVCLDEGCEMIEIGEEFDETSGTYWHSDGYYDSSTGPLNAGMEIKRIYRNTEDPDAFFSVEASGFLGEFKEVVIEGYESEIPLEAIN